jgi:hypothetical protein
MDEDKSLWYVGFTGIVLTFIFIIALNRSTGLGIDFGTALLNVLGAIVAILLTGVGFALITYVLSICAQSGEKNLGAFFLLVKEKREWSQKMDSFREKSEKEIRDLKYGTNDNQSDIKTLFGNDNFHNQQIKEIREYIGIDAQKAEEKARKEIMDNAQ